MWVIHHLKGRPVSTFRICGSILSTTKPIIEQFDKSSASWNVPLQRDWRIINHVLNSPRYEMAVASIPVHKVGVCIFVFENHLNKNFKVTQLQVRMHVLTFY